MTSDDRDNPEIGRRIDAGGIETNYHDRGEGRPVVLLHGSGPGVTAWANWRLVIPELARNCRVLAPDIVGFGYTERPTDASYDLPFWLAHLVGFLDALGLERVSLVGNSFGGALALAMAVHHPQRVDRLVLMGSVGLDFPITPGLDQVWGYTPSVQNMKALIDLFVYDKSLVTDDLAEMRYRASIRPGVQESYAAMFPPPRQEGVRRLAQSEDAVRAIGHETLVIHGREDRVIPPEVGLRLHRLIPRSELHMFGACGHWTQIEKRDRFVRLLRDFLVRSD